MEQPEQLIPAPLGWFVESPGRNFSSSFDDPDDDSPGGTKSERDPSSTTDRPSTTTSNNKIIGKVTPLSTDSASTKATSLLVRNPSGGRKTSMTWSSDQQPWTLPRPHELNNNSHPLQQQQQQVWVVGAPRPAPSWQEFSSQVLPAAARELLTTSWHRLCYTAQLSYAKGRWQRQYSDLGNQTSGYWRPTPPTRSHPVRSLSSPCIALDQAPPLSATAHLFVETPPLEIQHLPPISSLPWVDRQLVQEWRTYLPHDDDDEEQDGTSSSHRRRGLNFDRLDDDFHRARILVPMPIPRPTWREAEACFACHRTFGPTRLRHHCRLCGQSFCQAHSANEQPLPHLGYDPHVPERVCDACQRALLHHRLAERVAWRLARCRDCTQHRLAPYFETGVDTLEQAALRLSQAALEMARRIPLGVQAKVAVETVDVLRKYGLNGIYTIMLRQDFLAAADLLRKALGINRTSWPLSVHELSAAIFYALAQHRALRGLHPDREDLQHAFRGSSSSFASSYVSSYRVRTHNDAQSITEEDDHQVQGDAARISLLVSGPSAESSTAVTGSWPGSASPVCDPLPDEVLTSLIFYAPLALNFIYLEKEVDMQLLAAQQGWRLLYAYLEQEAGPRKNNDRPASALFIHEERRIACMAIRGTATIQDVVTDIRQVPVPFPEFESDAVRSEKGDSEWTKVSRGHGLAVCGMAAAAMNLYREHIDSLMYFAERGYRLRLTGHSLGGGVATLLGVLLHFDLKGLHGTLSTPPSAENDAPMLVYAYGTPSCLDEQLARFVEPFVTTVVLHDDVVPRLTPASCRGLLKHLLHIRETWVKDHLETDLMAITERAATAWAPRWRGSFTLPSSSSSLKRYCRKQYLYGKKKLLSVKKKLELIGGEFQVALTDSSLGPYGGKDDVPDQLQTVEEATEDATSSVIENGVADASVDALTDMDPKPVIDFMGGIEAETQGILIDGEEFFEADDSLVERDEMESSAAFADARDHLHRSIGIPTEDVGKIAVESEPTDKSGCDTPGAVVLEEIPLPRMFIPGKIVHIYSQRGVYKAAYTPRTFRDLRRISCAGNLLADHKCKAYYEALLEVRTVRNAVELPPRWTAFDEDDTCSCCASRFTWASTSNSAAQEARDKHNCRSCGALVCDPCSLNRVPLPSMGLTLAARVCDRCYNNMDGVFTRPTDGSTDYNALKADEIIGEKPVRQRPRRSSIVDDLSSRVQSTKLGRTACVGT